MIGTGIEAVGDLHIERLRDAITFRATRFVPCGDDVIFEGEPESTVVRLDISRAEALIWSVPEALLSTERARSSIRAATSCDDAFSSAARAAESPAASVIVSAAESTDSASLRTWNTDATDCSVIVLCSRAPVRSASVPSRMTRTPLVIAPPRLPTRPISSRRCSRVREKLAARRPTSSSAKTRGSTSNCPAAMAEASCINRCIGAVMSRARKYVATAKTIVVSAAIVRP